MITVNAKIVVHFKDGPTIVIHETGQDRYDSLVIKPSGRIVDSRSPEHEPSDATIKAMQSHVVESDHYMIRVEMPHDRHWCVDVCMTRTQGGWIASGLVVCDLSQYAYSEHDTHFGAIVGMVGKLIY